MSTKSWRILGAMAVFGLVFSLLWWNINSNGQGEPGELQSPLSTSRVLPPTPPEAGQPYRFVAFGDWGAGTPFQRDIAGQLHQLHQRAPFDAVLMLGDNIYEVGDVKKHGKAYFTDMYAPLIAKQVRFIVALGNHDVLMGHQNDQMAFFKMPGAYYQTALSPELDVFVLDTNTFAKSDVQQRWLENALEASQKPWKIVMGHHPIYSSGQHGVNRGLVKTLQPILERRQVPFYLAGHDHNYERLRPINGVQYVISGGAGAYLRGAAQTLPESLVFHKAHHFLSFELQADRLMMTVIDKTGAVIDRLETRLPDTQPRLLEKAS